MTIAAGVRCADGIVICADTEHTAGEGRYDRPKIFGHPEGWLLVSGSGWADYIKMAFDKLCERFAEGRPQNPADARKIVERLVLNIYQKNIATVFRVGESNSPEIYLIVGVRCLNGELALIKTTHTSVILSPLYESVGIGSNVFEYWAKFFLNDSEAWKLSGAFVCLSFKKSKLPFLPVVGGQWFASWQQTLWPPRCMRAFLLDVSPLLDFRRPP